MLFLVKVPSLQKRIQQNADSAEEAIRVVFSRLTEKLRGSSTISDCSAIPLEDPMDQFKLPSDLEQE